MQEGLCAMVKPPRAVIFDVDGTLLSDSIHLDKHNFIVRDVLRRPDLSLSTTEWQRIRGFSDDDAYDHIAAKVAKHSLTLAMALPRASYLALARDYLHDHIDDIAVRPGVRELLCVVERFGLVMGVATNADWRETERKLSTTGLAKFFHFFVCLDGVMPPKPAPDLYELGVSLVRGIVDADVLPEQVLAIEDTYVGACAALDAGCRVLLCPQDSRELLGDSLIAESRKLRITASLYDCVQYLCPPPTSRWN